MLREPGKGGAACHSPPQAGRLLEGNVRYVLRGGHGKGRKQVEETAQGTRERRMGTAAGNPPNLSKIFMSTFFCFLHQKAYI